MSNRRDFLKTGLAVGAGLLGPWNGDIGSAHAAPRPSKLTKFVDPLLSQIPVLTPIDLGGADYYEIYMAGGRFQFSSRLPVTAPAGFKTTWGYGSGAAFFGYLGPTIEAQSGRPVVVKFINHLPADRHPVQASIDPTVPDPMMYPGLAPGRATPHLHGGFVDPRFDGHPHSWFTALGEQGTHYATLDGAAPNEAIYEYSNEQPAAMLWYHDHAMGITRLNAYAGLAALYFVRDPLDTGTADNPLGLPAAPYEVPLVIQDKDFNADGSLFYPTVGLTADHPVWVPEFFANTPVINGTAYPYFNVEPRRYRFRVVNGSQARFYNLWFDHPARGPIPFWLIGMEQSLTPQPVPLLSLLISPGERADLIVDFSTVPFGSVLTLMNNAKAPFPGGRGGAINQLMQFRVVTPRQGTDNTVQPANLVLPPVPPLLPTSGAPIRQIVMLETMDPATGAPLHVRLNEKWFDEGPIDETPGVGTTEIWQFVNLTGDAHPMHAHLVRFQVLNRQAFNAAAFTADYLMWVAAGRVPPEPDVTNYLAGAPTPPLPEELGWKDTVKSYPGEVTRIIAKFDLPPGVAPPAEYVYHCHILEHEENEMMRPFQVVP
jgi:spore coat protein A